MKMAETFEQWLAANDNLIKFVANKVSPTPSVDFDDYCQAARMAIFAAWDRFDPDGIGTRSAWAGSVARNEMFNLRLNGTWKRNSTSTRIPERELINDFNEELGQLHLNEFEDDFISEMDFTSALSHLPTRSRFILLASLEGFSTRNMAEFLDIGRTRIQELLNQSKAQVAAEIGINL